MVPAAPFWQDPTALAINRRQAHVPLRSFRGVQHAVQQLTRPPWVKPAEHYTEQNELKGSRQQQLSGCEWQFQVFDRPEAVPNGFWSKDFDASKFGKVIHGGQEARVAKSFDISWDASSDSRRHEPLLLDVRTRLATGRTGP